MIHATFLKIDEFSIKFKVSKIEKLFICKDEGFLNQENALIRVIIFVRFVYCK